MGARGGDVVEEERAVVDDVVAGEEALHPLVDGAEAGCFEQRH